MTSRLSGEFPGSMYQAAAETRGEGWEAMAQDAVGSLETYVRERPASAMLWALGIGFVLGWRLKPW